MASEPTSIVFVFSLEFTGIPLVVRLTIDFYKPVGSVNLTIQTSFGLLMTTWMRIGFQHA
jgi:hypothetical protein